MKYEWNNKNKRNKFYILCFSLLLLTVMTIGGTTAYLLSRPEMVINTFTPAKVSCQVTENFDGVVKTDVNVLNTSDIDVYVRIKLVSYRVNYKGEHIGGNADIPSFTPGKDWVKNGDYYYYTKPIKPNEKPATNLIDRIDTTGPYYDADGGSQVIEVMAEAIQAQGVTNDNIKAVVKAWGVDPETLN